MIFRSFNNDSFSFLKAYSTQTHNWLLGANFYRCNFFSQFIWLEVVIKSAFRERFVDIWGTRLGETIALSILSLLFSFSLNICWLLIGSTSRKYRPRKWPHVCELGLNLAL